MLLRNGKAPVDIAYILSVTSLTENILPQLLKTCAAILIIIQRFGCEQQICPEGKWWVDC